MNNTKAGSYGKLIAFFLVAVILLCAFGFAVEGWQPESDHTLADGADSGVSGGETNNKKPTNEEPEEQKPKYPTYVDDITGLEIQESEQNQRYISFCISSSSPLYGIAGTQLLVEIPAKDEETRYLVFTKDTKSIAKIGDIAPTRGYISNVVKSFDSLLVSYGSDDTVPYTSADISTSHLDVEKNTGYSYSEYTKYHYSNGDLINAAITNLGLSVTKTQNHTMPYRFVDFGADAVHGSTSANTVTVPYSNIFQTEFHYSNSTGTYVMSKNSDNRLDTISSDTLEFTNVFVLFASSVTYEGEDGAELVMNTVGEGKGIYISGGTAKNITWSSDSLGNMCFFDESGAMLTVNRGTSYIGFVKSAKMSEVKLT